jgi:hypothetical protein
MYVPDRPCNRKDTQPACTPEEEEEDLQAMILGIL